MPQAFPMDNLILTHYMISLWWLNLLDGIGHNIICPGVVAQILVTNNNITTLGYTYSKLRSRTPLNFSQNFTHRPTNCMDTLKVSLDSCTQMEGLIPTTYNPPQGVHWN